MALNIENYLPVVQENGGLTTALPVTINGNLTVTGTTTIAGISLTDLTVTGNTSIGDAVTDTLTVKGATSIQTTSASGLVVGRQGATNPVLQVDASTASVLTGLKLTGAGTGAGFAIAVVETGGTNNNLTIDAMGSGTISLGATSTGNITLARATGVTGAVTVTSAGASALAVGRQGATNPVLTVDASTATVVTGISLKGAAAAGGMAVSVTSSGTDESLTIDAKGTGTITLNGTATGNIVMGRAMTGVSSSMTGALTGKSGTAVPATAGAVAAGAPLVMNSNGITIECTTDVPTHTRPKGSICINLGGSSTTTRMYVNTDGAGTWTPFTTGA